MSRTLRLTISIAFTLCALAIPTVKLLAQPVKNQSYAWSGEVLMYNEKGKTVTVKAPYLEHINRYIGEFTRGDKVVLNWATPRPGETEAVSDTLDDTTRVPVRSGVMCCRLSSYLPTRPSGGSRLRWLCRPRRSRH